MIIKSLHFLVTVRKPVIANNCILQSGTMLAQTKIATIRDIKATIWHNFGTLAAQLKRQNVEGKWMERNKKPVNLLN